MHQQLQRVLFRSFSPSFRRAPPPNSSLVRAYIRASRWDVRVIAWKVTPASPLRVTPPAHLNAYHRLSYSPRSPFIPGAGGRYSNPRCAGSAAAFLSFYEDGTSRPFTFCEAFFGVSTVMTATQLIEILVASPVVGLKTAHCRTHGSISSRLEYTCLLFSVFFLVWFYLSLFAASSAPFVAGRNKESVLLGWLIV
ncbi:hypothetical protein DFH08DRAFT_971921 [Mycena albidolilacea]|uniref:Uncharacterized protein n=1 Tax=Mycena albidolilacea TaxID=1033008 RepID=A0AAD7EE72_9AGAR|nr:hypothetical protein DFH08DRAFT_971921 [Mycena albidolilacea]